MKPHCLSQTGERQARENTDGNRLSLASLAQSRCVPSSASWPARQMQWLVFYLRGGTVVRHTRRPANSNVGVGSQSHGGTTEARTACSERVLHPFGDTHGRGAFVLGLFHVSVRKSMAVYGLGSLSNARDLRIPFHLENTIKRGGRVTGPGRGGKADTAFKATAGLQSTKGTQDDAVGLADCMPVSVFSFPTLSLSLSMCVKTLEPSSVAQSTGFRGVTASNFLQDSPPILTSKLYTLYFMHYIHVPENAATN